jgi:hypothetical protein
MRYWWTDAAPKAVSDWFQGMSFQPGGGGDRDDEYLLEPKQTELGVKLRGDKPGVEVKGLVRAPLKAVTVEPFTGSVELWVKWTSSAIRLEGAPTVRTRKTRWLRKFDTRDDTCRELELGKDEKPVGGVALPDNGCNVELTRVRVDGWSNEWWTLGFEAFGSLEDVAQNLERALACLAPGAPKSVTAGATQGSYPAWLGRVAPRR